jgi:hypothetical protein
MLRDIHRLTGQAAAKDAPVQHEAVWQARTLRIGAVEVTSAKSSSRRPRRHQLQIGDGYCFGQNAGETRQADDDEQVQARGAVQSSLGRAPSRRLCRQCSAICYRAGICADIENGRITHPRLVRAVACTSEPSDATSPSLFWTSIAASLSCEPPRRLP